MNKRLKKQKNSNKNVGDFKKKYLKSSFFQSVFSKLSFKNITIIRSFITIVVISILTTLVIGITSFVTINGTYINLKLMYTSCLQREILFNSINVHLNILRENVSLHIEYPQDQYSNNINKEIDSVYEELAQFKSLELSGDNDEMNKIIDQQFLILKNRCSTITQLKNTNTLTKDSKDKNKLSFQGEESNFSSSISTAVTKNKDEAEQLFSKTEKAYVSGIAILVILFIISIILISLIATVVIKSLKKSIKSFTGILDTMSMGDFTVDIKTDEKSEIGIMKKNLASTISSISHIFKEIKEGSLLTLEKAEALSAVSREMDGTMQQVAVAIQGMAEGASVQSTELMVINDTFDKFGDEIGSIVTSIKVVDQNTKAVNHKAQGSNVQLSSLVETINDISNSFENTSGKIQGLGIKISEINKITDIIKSIAEQTNLLSLNASIEAARAGEAGRGFAVVANEIKKLAEQSKSSSNDINSLIQDISKETGAVVSTTNGVNEDLKQQITVIENSVQDFKEIIEDINDILPQIEEINNTVEGINNKKDHIVEIIHSTASIAEENSASSEEIAASTQEVTASTESLANTAQLLEDTSNNLIKQVNNFKLKEDIR
ncbi:methyl-accepting chemotaxis protein [Clostridium gelidum]|uniref:Methyl-accepting chemotaxis protein n=1 Tax=Clostridium gelidum TaxID=704125 RepID=A0ABM7T9J0_9CLOT|nr:methyl-accepting chemotaxis protein [Clostridium gelidum]BCZ47766.1 methyl-accepting chemotaxis protein [Clostridium gelidum]